VGDHRLAYTARGRLQRVVLACTQHVARQTGYAEPVFPGRYSVPACALAVYQDICEIANRLLDRTQAVCQPSEPLDDRWVQGWAEIVADLRQLRGLLTTATNSHDEPEQR
jgi:hypothetical protein